MARPVSTISRALVRGELSLAVLDTTALVREAARRHSLKAGAASVLGNTLTASAYLCGWLKGENSALTVSILSNGDFGRVSVLGDGNMRLRGYVENPACQEGRLGEGTLLIVRDDGQGLPFSGTVPLVSEEMDENFAAYFAESEQIPTGVALSVVCDGNDVVRAGGVFLQALPQASEEARATIKSDTARLKELLVAGQYDGIFQEYGVDAFETREVKFACTCSKKRVESLLFAMGREQALALCEEDGQISVHCEYCNSDYVFDKAQIIKLFQKI